MLNCSRTVFLALLLTCTAQVALRAAEEPFRAGFLWDQFSLTLEPGTRTEAAGPLYYHQERGSESTWAVPPLFSYTRDPELDMVEFDIAYPLLTYDRYGDQFRWQLFQLLSFSGGASQTEEVRNRFTIFPIYFQQRSSGPAENYTAFLPFYGYLKHRLMRDEISFVMFPIYLKSRKRDVVAWMDFLYWSLSK